MSRDHIPLDSPVQDYIDSLRAELADSQATIARIEQERAEAWITTATITEQLDKARAETAAVVEALDGLVRIISAADSWHEDFETYEDWSETVQRAKDALANISPAAKALLAKAQKWEAAESRGHVVEIRETSFGLEHPPSCRERSLIDCPVNRALEGLTEAPRPVGRYRVQLKHYGLEFAALGKEGE